MVNCTGVVHLLSCRQHLTYSMLLPCDKHIAESSGKHTCTRVGTSPVCEPFRTLNAVTCKPEGSPRLPDRPPCIILPISSGPYQLPSTIHRGKLRRCPWAIDHLTTLVWQDAEGDGASRLAGRLLRQSTQAVRQRHSQVTAVNGYASQSECASPSSLTDPFSAPDVLHWRPVVAAAAAAPDLDGLHCTPSAGLLHQM